MGHLNDGHDVRICLSLWPLEPPELAETANSSVRLYRQLNWPLERHISVIRLEIEFDFEEPNGSGPGRMEMETEIGSKLVLSVGRPTSKPTEWQFRMIERAAQVIHKV